MEKSTDFHTTQRLGLFLLSAKFTLFFQEYIQFQQIFLTLRNILLFTQIL